MTRGVEVTEVEVVGEMEWVEVVGEMEGTSPEKKVSPIRERGKLILLINSVSNNVSFPDLPCYKL